MTKPQRKTKELEPVEVVIHRVPWDQLSPVRRAALANLAEILFRPLPDELPQPQKQRARATKAAA